MSHTNRCLLLDDTLRAEIFGLYEGEDSDSRHKLAYLHICGVFWEVNVSTHRRYEIVVQASLGSVCEQG